MLGNDRWEPVREMNNEMIKKRITVCVSTLILLLLAAVFLGFRSRDTEEPRIVAGEAVAVMTTQVSVIDGVLDTRRPLDEFYYPIGLAFMGNYLIVADSMADRIQIMGSGESRRIGIPGLFGFAYGDSGAFVDGFRENAMFRKPAGVFVINNEIIVADTQNHAIRRICSEFVITIAGNGTSGYRSGYEGEARFNHPRSAVMCVNGYIYVADTLNHAIRRINPMGYVTTFAGAGGQSGYQNGTLAQARFFEPAGLYISGNILYVADSANHAIRAIDIAGGTVSTIAGRPGEIDRRTGYPAGGYIDGPNQEALFNFPRNIALMEDGSILIADSLNHAIRMISDGYTRTIAGNGASDPFYGSVENLGLTRPEGIAINGNNLFISDSVNNRIVVVPLTDRILAGRPSRHQMQIDTGLTINTRFAYTGPIRVFIGDQRVNFGRVQPWNSADNIFIPIRPLFEALGADVTLNESTNVLSIVIGEQETLLNIDRDYFIMRGVMVTTLNEIIRLFPHRFEWFPEMSLIAVSIPPDLKNER